MKQLKHKGELYNACAPRRVNGELTCDAWNSRTGKVVKDFNVLNALGNMLISGKFARENGGVVGELHRRG